MTDSVRPDVLIAFVAMMAVTVAARVGGFWVMRYIPITPRVRRMLDALPGSIIVAASLPMVVSGGVVVIIAIVAAMTVTIIRRNDFVAVIVGMAVAALARALGFSG
ncbi:MAG: AzlD domain-containing protein [Xanthobacteraceae bacterium]|nr:AzlD domain-containing protein [Xanthobacteraceae bacterium]